MCVIVLSLKSCVCDASHLNFCSSSATAHPYALSMDSSKSSPPGVEHQLPGSGALEADARSAIRSRSKLGQHADEERRARRWPLPGARSTNSSVRFLSDANTAVLGSMTLSRLNLKYKISSSVELGSSSRSITGLLCSIRGEWRRQ